MKLNFLLYAAIIIMYIIFLVFLFFESVEGLVFILLFLLTAMSGYKLILDLYEYRNILNIDFSKIFGENTNFITSLFLNPLTLLVLIVMLFVFVVLYLYSKVKINAIFINILLIAAYVLFSMPSKKAGEGYFQLYTLFSLPVLTTLLSLIMIIVTIFTLSSESPTGKLNLSSKYRGILNRYKGMLLSVVLTIISTFILLTRTKRTKTDDLNGSTVKESSTFNTISAASLFVSYILSYVALNDSYDLYKLIRFNMKTNDQYRRVTQGSCTGGMEEDIQDEIDESSIETPERTSNTEDIEVGEGIFAGIDLPLFKKLV